MHLRPSLVAIRGLILSLVVLGGCASGVYSSKNQPSVVIDGRDAIRFVVDTLPVDSSVSSPTGLTLSDAIYGALQNDAEVQAALARVRVAEADAGQARLLPNPVLSVSLRLPKGAGTFIDAGLTEDFIALIQRPGRIAAADNRLRAAGAEALTAALDVLAEVQERYIAVQSHDALLPLLRQRRDLLGQLFRLAEDRLRQGEGIRLDVTALDAQRVDLDVEIAEQQLNARRDRLSLARLIGQPSKQAEWHLDPLLDPVQARVASELTCVQTALRRRPEVASQRWELRALGFDARYAGMSIFEGSEVGGGAEQDTKWSAGPSASVPIPLFDWGQERRAKAEALWMEANHKLTKLQRQVIEEVRAAHAEQQLSADTFNLVKTRLLPVQEKRRADTEAAYRAGQTDVTALIVADQDLAAARTKLIELKQKAITARIKLERAVGGPGSDLVAPTTGSTSSDKQESEAHAEESK